MKLKKIFLMGLLILSMISLVSAYNVTGKVTSTGTGIEDVRVTIGTLSDLTDNSGNYIIGELTNGSYTYSTMKDGYKDTTGSVTVFGDTSKNITISTGISWVSGKENVEGAMDLFIAFVSKVPTIIMYLFIVIVLLGIAYAIKEFAGKIGKILHL